MQVWRICSILCHSKNAENLVPPPWQMNLELKEALKISLNSNNTNKISQTAVSHQQNGPKHITSLILLISVTF